MLLKTNDDKIEKTKKLSRFLTKRNISILHRDTLISYPANDRGILSFIPKFIPVSHSGKLKNSLLKKLREDLLNEKVKWKDKIAQIWDKELEIIIIYKLGSKFSITDVDNLNKFMIDSMKGILFKDDSQIRLLIGRKDKLNLTYSRGQYAEKAIIRIDLFENSKINRTLEEIFLNPIAYKIPVEDD